MSQNNVALSADLAVGMKHIRDKHVPALGFGTYELEGEVCQHAVETALEVGYRHIDTARAYENETFVGRGLRNSSVSREEIYLTTKVRRDALDPMSVEHQIRESLESLQTDYLDLVLIHWPNPEFSLEHTLQAMLAQREAGRVREVGVSNFPLGLFKRAMAYAPVFCNQVEYHPLLAQEELLKIARSHDTLLTAYSPLGQGEVADYPILNEIGDKYQKSAMQVALRWLIEQDHVAAIPRSSRSEHIKSNFDIFDFELDKEDHKKSINCLKITARLTPILPLTGSTIERGTGV